MPLVARPMRAPDHYRSDRLTLTRPTLFDAAAMFEAYASDPDVTRYLSWPTHRTVADTQAFLTFSQIQWEQSGVGPYLIRDRSDGRLLGSTGLAIDEPGVAMTGYALARLAWGMGYATEALQSMLEISRLIGLQRVYALCHPDHRASSHVLEKCGFFEDPRWDARIAFPNLFMMQAGQGPGPQPVRCYVLDLA